VTGFAAGVALLLALGAYSRRVEARAQASAVPVGLVTAVGLDLLIDGLLVGLGSRLGSNQGVVLTIALTLEILFLALSVSTRLAAGGASRFTAALVPSLLGLGTAIGAIGGAALLGGASQQVLAGVLAFGAAALLYLVTEELLVEAHETTDSPLLAGLFFLGFIALYALAA
jgi:ZIP family zinc transporter